MTRISVVLTSMLLALQLAGETCVYARGGPAGSRTDTNTSGSKQAECHAVMDELASGKKPTEVAIDLGIPLRRVRRCRRQAAAASSPTSAPSP